jgi:flagellar motility protein MotE (MotC chaperone)
MSLRVPFLRLLPMTILAMAALPVVKSVALVRATVPDAAPAATANDTPPASATTPAAPLAAAAQPSSGPAAKQSASPATKPSAGPAAPVGASVNPVAAPPPPDPPVSDSERALLLDLRHRSVELDAREAALTSREGVLSVAEKRLAARVSELSALQAKLEALEKARHDRDDSNWAGLTKLYEAMKPRDAATIFNDLDMSLLLQVVDRMKEAKAALVLAAMQPERARQVTAKLAQMSRKRATAPKHWRNCAPAASAW